MKNKYKIFFIIPLLMVMGCSDDDKLPTDFAELNVSGGAYATDVTVDGGTTSINKLDPASSTFFKTYDLVSPKGGTDITTVDIYLTLVRGVDPLSSEVFLKSYASDAFMSGGAYPQLNAEFIGSELITALGIDPAILEGGDTFAYRLALTNPDGTFSDVSANFDNQSADHTFSSTVVCIAPPPSGTWTINMNDSYGDGWQPTNANGSGPGVTITLDSGAVIELGLCNNYEDSGFDCVDETASGSDTFEIPAGTESADFVFNGDFWGEMSFELIAPSGNTVAAYSAGSSAGPIALNLCNE